MRKLTAAALLLSVLTVSTATQARPTNNQNCVGRTVSFLGPIGAGLFELMALFGAGIIGEVGSTHCDPSFD